MEEQVSVIYAGVNGYLDGLPVDRIKAYEEGLLALLRTSHPEMLEAIRSSKDLKDDVAEQAEGGRRRLHQVLRLKLNRARRHTDCGLASWNAPEANNGGRRGSRADKPCPR